MTSGEDLEQSLFNFLKIGIGLTNFALYIYYDEGIVIILHHNKLKVKYYYIKDLLNKYAGFKKNK